MLPEANYEESEAGNLPLPSPLEGEDGGRIGTATRWNRRRAAIRAEFARIMYGELPPRPEAVRFELRRECDDAIDGIAIRRKSASIWSRGESITASTCCGICRSR